MKKIFYVLFVIVFFSIYWCTFPCHAEDCLSCHKDMPQSKLHVDAKNFEASVHGSNGCQSCHMDIETYPHPKNRAQVDCANCHSDEEAKIKKSFHGQALFQKGEPSFPCVSCHGKHDILKPNHPESNICSRCHESEAKEYSESIHGKAVAQNMGDAATCTSCHASGHELLKTTDSESPVYQLNLPKTCGKCHANAELAKKHNIPVENAFMQYADTIHGKGILKSGLLVSANCANCHGSHNIKPHKDPKSTIFRTNVPQTCGKCHEGILKQFNESIHGQMLGKGNPEAPVCTDCHKGHEISRVEDEKWKMGIIGECGSCHLNFLSTYQHTYHGKVTSLGYSEVAKCSDCHGSHNILPVSDEKSTLSSSNIKETCAKCHPKATQNFTEYLPHADYHNKEKYPLLYYVFNMFSMLLIAVFAFWWLHTLLWAIRSVIVHRKHKKAHTEARKTKQKYYIRFPLYHRLTHVLIIVSFLGLAMTGLPLKYSHEPWAVWLSYVFGGIHNAGHIHRFCAILTFIYSGMHLGFIAYNLFKKKAYGMLWGVDSLVPQPKDIFDFINHMKWFVGLGERPKFGRWTYWEKFDYWAVFWGVAVIGGSGLMLWLPTLFTAILPGWVINLATIVHSDEALLATGFIFTVHFFNSHLRPEKFPMDDVIFTGRLSEHELAVDKPAHYERLKSTGELEKIETNEADKTLKMQAKIFGFLAVIIGVILALFIFIV